MPGACKKMPPGDGPSQLQVNRRRLVDENRVWGGRDGDARRRDAGRAPAGFLLTSNLLGSIPGTSNGRCGALSSTADGELQGCSGGGSCVGGRKVGHRGGSNFCASTHPSSRPHHPSSSTSIIVHFSPPLFSFTVDILVLSSSSPLCATHRSGLGL